MAAPTTDQPTSLSTPLAPHVLNAPATDHPAHTSDTTSKHFLPGGAPKGITIIFERVPRAQVTLVANPTGRTSIVPEGETKHPPLPVLFVKQNGST